MSRYDVNNNIVFLAKFITMAHVYLAIFWGRGELVAFYAHAYNELYYTILYLLIPKQLRRERERERKRMRDFLGHLVYP